MALFALLLLGSGISAVQNDPRIITFGLILIFAVVTIWLLSRNAKSQKRERRFRQMLEKHDQALVGYYRQSVHHDAFGNRVDGKWWKYVDTFLRTQVLDDPSQFQVWRKTAAGELLARRVDTFAQRRSEELESSLEISSTSVLELHSRDYERHCAETLKQRGWQVQVTQASRDSGADVVAQKGRHRIVVQCKRYAKPVGNRGVQEAHAAVRLYSGTIACVVAPSGFTAQARREAFGLKIHLLDHVALPAFADQVEAGSFN